MTAADAAADRQADAVAALRRIAFLLERVEVLDRLAAQDVSNHVGGARTDGRQRPERACRLQDGQA